MQELLDLIRQYGALIYALLFAYCAVKSGALPLFAGYAAKAGALDPISVCFLPYWPGLSWRRSPVRARSPIWSGADRPPATSQACAGGRSTPAQSPWRFLHPRLPLSEGPAHHRALPVGLTDMPWRRFTLLNLASASLWSVLLVGGGYLLGHVFAHGVMSWWGGLGVLLLVIFSGLTFLGWRQAARELIPEGTRP